MQDKPIPVIPYRGPAAPRRPRKVSPLTIAALVVLCIVAGVIWYREDQSQRFVAEQQRQMDQEAAQFRQQEFQAAEARKRALGQLAKESRDAKARAARIAAGEEDPK